MKSAERLVVLALVAVLSYLVLAYHSDIVDAVSKALQIDLRARVRVIRWG